MKFSVLPSVVYDKAIDVVVFDDTTKAANWWPTTLAYKAVCHTPLVKGFWSWSEAFHWVNSVAYGHPIKSLQVWGTGSFGTIHIGDSRMNVRSTLPDNPMYGDLVTLRARLTPDATIWFRASHVFCTDVGQRFAQSFATFMGCTVAGHTHGLNLFHSGLRTIEPEGKPLWEEPEGLLESRDGTMQKAESAPWLPRTIMGFQNSFPRSWR